MCSRYSRGAPLLKEFSGRLCQYHAHLRAKRVMLYPDLPAGLSVHGISLKPYLHAAVQRQILRAPNRRELFNAEFWRGRMKNRAVMK